MKMGVWVPAAELGPYAELGEEVVCLEWPGEGHDLPYFSVEEVIVPPEGDVTLVTLHGESEREWSAQFGRDELVWICPPLNL